MKIWYNKVNESRRAVVEALEPVITIGRDPANTVCLQSPLVSRQPRRGARRTTASCNWKTSG